MIQPIRSPQLSSVKPRTGLQSIADLIPRLVRQYEMQAELRNRQSAAVPISCGKLEARQSTQQATFAWFD